MAGASIKQNSENPWNIQETAFAVFVNTESSEDNFIEEELYGLCEAANVEILGHTRQRVERPTKRSFIGSGKLLELKAFLAETQADVVLFDCELTGIQARNITEVLEKKVIDRTQLILDIFARRAKSREGQLQVELAQLTYMMPRLMSVYTKFERQRGGIGMRGPGETKLEADKRMIRDKIRHLTHDIEDVKKHRQLQRNSRRKNPYPFATIVGYTSAGKSTLMNTLSGSELLADAMPFATLDPTTRKVELPDGYAVFLTDTVGFIRNLPTHLVAAFRATLEEVLEADFVLHVIDISAPNWEAQRDAVIDTLDNLGAHDKEMIQVLNKVDIVEDRAFLTEAVSTMENSVSISAEQGTGIPDLLNLMRVQVQKHLGLITALIPYSQQSLLDACFKYGRVLKQEYREDGVYIEAELVPHMRNMLDQFVIETP